MSAPDTSADAARAGRIVTFYSYKGGTGRSMALANVAWILASHGQRVLMIDWDLEAPGLHRYFHPFIHDKELTQSPGLIDFFAAFVEGPVTHETESSSATPWFAPFTNLEPYTFSLNWEFPGEGTLDLVPAGQQSSAYGVRVTGFDWGAFYNKRGGGVFLETVKKRLREEYDWILIDSRTGLSDTSGICTVQMPDDLVVCFTLNNQSISGASAVAEFAFSQRLKPSGEPGLRVWPVPTRVEGGEKERLEAAQDVARGVFQRYLGHLPRTTRSDYWHVEVPYAPFFAYEEVLAVFADRQGHKLTVLSSLETLTGFISEGRFRRLGRMPESLRSSTLAKFTRVKERTSGLQLWLTFGREDSRLAHALAHALNGRLAGRIQVSVDALAMEADTSHRSLERLISACAGVLVLLTPSRLEREYVGQSDMEIEFARRHGKRMVVLLNGVSREQVASSSFARLLSEEVVEMIPNQTDEVVYLAQRLAWMFADKSSTAVQDPLDPDDPQAGRWGGESSRNGRTLSARVVPVAQDAGWFSIELRVEAAPDAAPLTSVEFHLHPTFTPSVVQATPSGGVATQTLFGWGAFTVGALLDEGRTSLELDLAQLPDAPTLFVER
jgi:hypothetical protein